MATHTRIRDRSAPFVAWGGLCVMVLAWLAAGIAVPAPAATASPAGWVVGDVVAHGSRRPVSGATVTLPGYGVRTSTDARGRFAFPRALATFAPARRITAVVTAPGWGRWTIRRAPLVPGQTLELNAELRPTAYTHTVEASLGPGRPRSPGASASGYTSTCTGWPYVNVPPQNISVYITAEGSAETYDFVFYLRHVLPDEWIASWDADALGAGAIAAKTYATYRTQAGHAYSGGAGCADITDSTADQVLDPTWSNSATDQAVYATFGSIAKKDGLIFLAQYFAGAPGDECAPVTGQYAGRMSQWGTQTCGTESVLWPDIVTTFYETAVWNVNEFQNFVLDPSVDSNGMYAWSWTASTTATRVRDQSYDGNWHETVAPTATGKTATFRQSNRPFNGTSTTAYHTASALQCPTSNATDCTITIKVIAVPATGASVTKSLTVVEPHDGAWRVYTFDPDPAGITHTSVTLSFVTKQTIEVDGVLLNAPFGGP